MNTVASHRTVGGVALARRHQPSCYSPGVARLTEEVCNTRRDIRYAALDLPQPVVPQTPPVAHQHLPPSGWTTTGDHTEARRPQAPSLASPSIENESLIPCGRTGSPGSQRRNVTRLEGPPRADTRESVDSQPHPRCLPPLGPPASFRETLVKRLAAPVSLRWSDSLDTFVTSDNKDPDKVNASLAQPPGIEAIGLNASLSSAAVPSGASAFEAVRWPDVPDRKSVV